MKKGSFGRDGKTWMDLGHVLEEVPVRFLKGLTVGVRRKEEVKFDSQVFVLSIRVESQHLLRLGKQLERSL